MFLRVGIVAAAFAAVILGVEPVASLAKPPDLPLDPRVVCPEGQESTPHARTDDVADDKIVKPRQPEPEPEPKAVPGESYLVKFGLDPLTGSMIVLQFWKANDAGEEELMFFVPIVRSPAVNSIACAAGNWEQIARVFLPKLSFLGQAEVPALKRINTLEAREDMDREYLEMLRSTQPLELAPVAPIEDARDARPARPAPLTGEKDHHQVDYRWIKRVNFDQQPDRAGFPQRNCLRTLPPSGSEATILYIEPAPRRLILREE